jgi:hypothetical protein
MEGRGGGKAHGVADPKKRKKRKKEKLVSTLYLGGKISGHLFWF